MRRSSYNFIYKPGQDHHAASSILVSQRNKRGMIVDVVVGDFYGMQNDIKKLVEVKMPRQVWIDASVKDTPNARNIIRDLLNHAAFVAKGDITLSHAGTDVSPWLKEVVEEAQMILNARLIAMLPANLGTPRRLQQHFRRMFEDIPRTLVRVFGPRVLEGKGFGLITSVGKSARNPPYMLVVERKGSGGKTICVVGKGITFDSGGLALKPFKAMKDEKYDKIGAVWAGYALEHVLKDPAYADCTIVGILPFAENAVSDRATRPGDVVISYDGKRVEITNPDAEGRLIMADAFAWAAKHVKPDLLIDIATLTGHAKTISCHHFGYFYASKEPWRTALEKSTYDLGERMIGMPQWDLAPEQLESKVADLKNSSDNCSTAAMATVFLKAFVPTECDWIHIDLANEIDESNLLPRGTGVLSVIAAIRLGMKK